MRNRVFPGFIHTPTGNKVGGNKNGSTGVEPASLGFQGEKFMTGLLKAVRQQKGHRRKPVALIMWALAIAVATVPSATPGLAAAGNNLVDPIVTASIEPARVPHELRIELTAAGTEALDLAARLHTGGGLITNPTMLVEFYGALGEGRVVSAESLAMMLDGGWRNPRTPDYHYGFGMFVVDYGHAFDHGGVGGVVQSGRGHDVGDDVDDRAVPAPLHRRDHRAHAHQRTAQVGPDHAVP